MKNTRYAVQFRRKREGKTDYKKRTKLLLSNKPRIIIRKTIRRIIVQVAERGEKGDKIIITTDSNGLKKHGWSQGLNICTAYLTGYMAGAKAKGKIKDAIADLTGSPHKGGRIYAALKGAIDAGISIRHDDSVFPKDERLKGAHLKEGTAKGISDTISKILQENK